MQDASDVLNNNLLSELFFRLITHVLDWTDPFYFYSWAIILFAGGLTGMSPLNISQMHIEETPTFATYLVIQLRRLLLLTAFILSGFTLVIMYGYVVINEDTPGDHVTVFSRWLFSGAVSHTWILLGGLASGNGLRLLSKRYLSVYLSKFFKKMWITQHDDVLSDIEKEVGMYSSKTYSPAQYYDLTQHLFLGLDQDEKPLYISRETWLEVNMQVIGPTRYGKGVLAGCLCDQSVRAGDSVFYIAPKAEKFLPHILYNAAHETGRKFYFLDLNDIGPGAWGPFLGGTEFNALSRLFIAIDLELSGEAGTDFYKVIEREALAAVIKKGRSLQALLKNLNPETSTRSTSTLKLWAQYQTFRSTSGKGFSIARAIKENAVVYVQGSLSDSVVKTATKCFISEVIQEAARMENERNSHLTLFVDEVRFLVSKQLADALATIVGFNVNIVTMYQSILDLMSPDDSKLDGKSLMQSINSNSQLKAIYGGADSETADWVSKLSGEKLVNVPKMEKSKINEAGAEIWRNDRMMSTESQALIHSNVVKVLPPRVCVLFRPMATAKVAFTSFVKVVNTTPLNSYLEEMKLKAESIKQQKTQTPKLSHQAGDEKAEANPHGSPLKTKVTALKHNEKGKI